MASTKSAKQLSDEQSVEKESEDSMHKKILVLTNDQEQLLYRRNKRDAIINGSLLGFGIALAVISIIVGAWTSAITLIGYSMWLGLVWFMERQLNQQRYIIKMQQGLHDLEREELDKLLAALPPTKSLSQQRREAAMRKGKK